MSILIFYYRGLDNPSAVTSLQDLIRRDAPSSIFLSETKLSSAEFGRVRDRLGYFNSLVVDYVGRSGGLAMLWKKNVIVDLISMFVHHIDVIVSAGLGEEEWRCTRFYGRLEVHNSHLSWSLLGTLAGQSDLPWLCLGDFNQIIRCTSGFWLSYQFCIIDSLSYIFGSLEHHICLSSILAT